MSEYSSSYSEPPPNLVVDPDSNEDNATTMPFIPAPIILNGPEKGIRKINFDFPENVTKVCRFDVQSQNEVDWSLKEDDSTDNNLFEIEQNGELSFKKAPNYENPTDSDIFTDNIYTVIVQANFDNTSFEKTITITIEDNFTETRLAKFFSQGDIFFIVTLLLFLLEVYPLVIFIRKHKNLKNLNGKEKTNLAKIINNLLGLLISTLGFIFQIIYVSINDQNDYSTLNIVFKTFLLVFQVSDFLIFGLVSPIIGIVKLVQTRKDPNDADKIIAYIQTIVYPILAIAYFFSAPFENYIEDPEIHSDKKNRRSILKKLLGSKK